MSDENGGKKVPAPIVIGVDLGETAAAVAATGLSLAAGLGAPAVLVHVDAHAGLLGDAFHAVDDESMRRMRAAYQGQAASGLRRMAAHLQHASDAVEVRVRGGSPSEEILAEAEDCGAQAIVVGSHVRRGLERWLLGRNALRLARMSDVPVFTVDPFHRLKKVRRALYATDLAGRAKVAETWAARIAGSLHAHLTVLHVCDLDPEMAAPYAVPIGARDRLERTLEERLEATKLDIAEMASRYGQGPAGLSARLFAAKDPAAAILDVAGKEESDLIILGGHGHHGVIRELLGSVAEGVLHRAHTHVLTVRDAG